MRNTEWWRTLSPAQRRSLCDGGRTPRDVVVVRFVEPGSSEEEPTADFYEYLANHEITLDDGRTFHICSHARTVVSSGRLPVGFECPRGVSDCPMRRLLDVVPEHDVVFRRCV